MGNRLRKMLMFSIMAIKREIIVKKVLEIFAQLKKMPLLCTRFDKEKPLSGKQKFLRKVFLKFLKNYLEV